MNRYLIPSTQLEKEHISIVGMKNYGMKLLNNIGIRIPKGIALTTNFFNEFIESNHLKEIIPNIGSAQNGFKPEYLQNKIHNGTIHKTLAEVLNEAYSYLSNGNLPNGDFPLAVRSSCNYEDLHNASFAGQYKSILNVKNIKELEKAVLGCFESIYSEQALDYLIRHNINPKDVAMSVLIQEMIDADKGVSGVILSVDPFSGSDKIIYIEATNGFCEAIVSGRVQPDSFRVKKNNNSVIHRTIGKKNTKITYRGQDIVYQDTDTNGFCLNKKQIEKLTDDTKKIETYLGYPVDLEYIIVGENDPIFVQVRPQIIEYSHYIIKTNVGRSLTDNVISRGIPVVPRSIKGNIHFFETEKRLDSYKERIVYLDRLDITDIPTLKNANGLIISEIGLGSHPALILREIGLPTIANINNALKPHLSEEDKVTLDTATGEIIKGDLHLDEEKIFLDSIPQTITKVYVASSTAKAYQPFRRVPVDGILMRGGEFTIVSDIQIHPQAILDYDAGKLNGQLAEKIATIIEGYPNATEFFISKLSEGIALVGSLVSRKKPLLYRFCDFPSSDYAKLVGGEEYEIKEQNPMIGLRGVTRMLNPKFQDSVGLEAAAVKRVKEDMGFDNLEILVAFCREPEDGKKVRKKLEGYGFPSCRIGMMVEVPSNYLCAKEFAEYFDFFLVGPVDLTQTALAADRNNTHLTQYHNPSGLVPRRAVETLLQNLNRCEKDVIIGSYELFKHYPEYIKYQSNNKILFAELADSLVESIQKLYHLEKEMGLQ